MSALAAVVDKVWVLTDDEGWQVLPIKQKQADGSVTVVWNGRVRRGHTHSPFTHRRLGAEGWATC